MSRSRLVARNVTVTLLTQLVSWALTFAVTLYLPRYIGDAGLGKLAFAGAFVTIFGVFVPLGTSTVLIKEIARDRSRTGELLMAAMLIRIPLGLLMTGLAIGAVYALGYPSLTRTLVIVAALGMIVGALNDALGAALQGQENLTRQSAAVLVEKFLSSGITLSLVFLKAPLWTLAAVGLFTGSVSLFVNATAFQSLLTTLRWPQMATVRYLTIAGLPFFASFVFRAVYNQVDIPLLSFMANDHVVGWYSMATRLLGSTMFIPVAVATALLPSLTRLHEESVDRFIMAIRRALGIVLLCVIPIAVPIILFPSKILFDVLHYPATFRQGAPVLAIYGVGCIFWYITQITGTTLIVLNRQGRMCRIFMVALAMTVAGCLVAIPISQRLLHNGAIGAALVDVGVEVYITAAFFAALPKGFFDWQSARNFFKAVGAAFPLLLAMLCLHNGWQSWIGLSLGVTAYLFLCYRFRCFDSQDVALFKQMLNRRPV